MKIKQITYVYVCRFIHKNNKAKIKKNNKNDVCVIDVSLAFKINGIAINHV